MTNKEIINKIKDNAELAWASYGHFHLIDKKFKKDDKYGNKKGVEITPTDILNMDYNGYKTDDSTFFNTHELKGDFSPTQAQQFFERYTLIGHIPDDKNRHIPYDKRGFSATIFYDKLNANYIIAFRGTKY